MDLDIDTHKGTIYDLLRTIKDPEKPGTLEDLDIVYEEGIRVETDADQERYFVEVDYKPTIPHCSLATLIGLCMRVKLERNLPTNHKISINVAEGTHNTRDEINKQINDKERTSAAMENPNIKKVVEKCIQEPD
ncbi:cytosolic iron-sulfur assembly component 2A-like [Styela clava]|uniref:cytosolic iron-sulfur assembly component 2A-like n=1 Tax=Styela clava TaxID=7725 RepID=UPI0019397751|nr:cytosolic iron-sulfur assembly component 2A-like [Styela clava]